MAQGVSFVGDVGDQGVNAPSDTGIGNVKGGSSGEGIAFAGDGAKDVSHNIGEVSQGDPNAKMPPAGGGITFAGDAGK